MLRRISGIFFAALALHLFSFAPAMASSAADRADSSVSADTAVASSQVSVELPRAAAAPVPLHFKSGVKYDPSKHEWVDRYSNKVVNLGIPGLNGKYGAQELLADSSTSTTTTTSTTAGGFPWKKFIIVTVMIAGVATAIAVPIACGHHNHHHGNNNAQQNQAAAYYFFHNQTLPVPTIPQGPNPFVPPGGKGGEGGGGGQEGLKALVSLLGR